VEIESDPEGTKQHHCEGVDSSMTLALEGHHLSREGPMNKKGDGRTRRTYETRSGLEAPGEETRQWLGSPGRGDTKWLRRLAAHETRAWLVAPDERPVIGARDDLSR
jgi:hypothetical protein